jgi:hypothetical protein
MLRPNREGTSALPGMRRDNRGATMRQIVRFQAQLEELKTELLKAAYFELWLEDQVGRLEAQ